jgi:outer membrane protein assembly factor BamB
MKTRKVALLCAFVFALACGATRAADEWRQFRGPDGQAIAPEARAPTEWSATKNIRWKTDLPGPGASSPVVFGDHIYLTCYSGYAENVCYQQWQKAAEVAARGDQSRLKQHVVCVNRANGRIAWSKEVPGAQKRRDCDGQLMFHGYASATCAVDSDAVYAFFGAAGLFAYSHDGTPLWQADLGSGTHKWGTGAAPVLYRNTLIVNAGVESGKLCALDRKTGRKLWEAGGIRNSWCMPALMETGRRTQVVMSVHNEVLAFDADTGRPAWKCAGVRDYVCSVPVVDGETAYVIGGRRGAGLAVKPGGQVVWTMEKGSNVSSPLVHNGRLYWAEDDRGTVYCVDAQTGKLVYEQRLEGRPMFYASVVLAGDNLYYLSRTKGTFVVAPGDQFRLVAHNVIAGDGTIWNATPVPDGDTLLLRSGKALYCIGAK